MISAIGGPTVALMTLVILIAGMTNGLAGFGFALVGTMALATVIDPATAVVFMIIPILAVNLSLVRDLSREELRTCSRRFGPLIGAALVGTVVGMTVLSRIPTQSHSDRPPSSRRLLRWLCEQRRVRQQQPRRVRRPPPLA